MHSELEILKSLVFDKLSFSTPETTTNLKIEELLCLAQTEQIKIKRKLFETCYQLTDEYRLDLYIHSIQNEITHLADLLYNYIGSDEIILSSPANNQLNFRGLQISVLLILEDILLTLETIFSKYFNIDALIPNRKREIAIRQFSDSLVDFSNYKNCVSPKLFQIITFPLKNFIDDPSTSTYHRFYYLKSYLSELFNLWDTEVGQEDISSEIKVKLIYLNFNTISYFNYVTSEISKDVSKLDSLTEKLDQLSWYLKEINQTLVAPGLAYTPHQISIKELLSEWLVEEVCHLDKKRSQFVNNNQLSINPTDGDFKLVTELSVPQYAFLLRTFVETGLFKNKKQDKPLTQLFATITQTKGAESISPKSLRQHFYKDDYRTREVVKNAVIKILNYIQKLNVLIILLSTLQDDYLQVFDITL